MSHIFISYSRSDITIAQKIVSALATSKLDAWIDWKSIPKGEDWEKEIYRGIEGADAFLFLLSPDSAVSQMCNKEIAHAARNGKRILPIFIADEDDRKIYDIVGKFPIKVSGDEISRRNFIKCREGRDNFDTALEEIRVAIRTDYEWLKYHTRLQVKSLEWERRKDTSRLMRGKELQEAEAQLAGLSNLKDPQPTTSQRQYVLASRTEETTRRRRTVTGLTIGSIVLIGLCIVAVIASIIAMTQRNIALTREQEAIAAQAKAEEERRIALSKGLATQSRLLFDEQLDLALLLSVLSGQIDASPEALGSLHDGLEHRPDLEQYLNGVPPSGVTRIAYTRDGSQLIGIGTDASIWRWDAGSGQRVGDPLPNPGRAVLGLMTGAGGEVWVIDLDDTGVFVWDASSGQTFGATIPFTADVDGDGKPDQPHIAALSPDGRKLATAVYEEISIWDLQTGGLLGKSDVMLGFPPSALEFSPDSFRLASAGNEWRIYWWDAQSGLNLGIWPTTQSRNITSLAFSADGRFIASGSVDGTVNLFDASSGQQFQHQPSYSVTTGQETPPPALGHPAEVRSVALSPDGSLLVSGAVDGNMLVWDTNTMTPFAVPQPAYVGPILTLAWNPNGLTFAAGGGDNSITIWRPSQTRRLLHSKTEAELNLNFVHETTQTEEAVDQNTVRVTHVNSGYYAISGCTEVVDAYAPCPTGYVEAYQPDGQQINLQPVEFNGRPGRLIFSADGTMLAVTMCRSTNGYDCPSSVISIWNLPGGDVKQYEASVVRIASMLFSPDSRFLASGGEGRDVMLLDLTSGIETSLSLLNLPGQILGLAFSPDGTRLTASASYEDPGPYANTIQHGQMAVWDTASGQLIAHVNLPGSTAGDPSFSEDGRLLEYLIQEGNEYPFQVWTLGLDQWQAIACRIANRNLTESEWQRYVIGENFRLVCP